MAGDYQEFLDYFKGKRVAVVGSGASVLDKDNGRFIDDHDIVVRINRSYYYEEYRRHVGSRCDVWSFGMGGREDLRHKMHLLFSERKYSMYPWHDSRWVPSYLREAKNHITLPPHFSVEAQSLCGGKPATTGADTLHFLVKGTDSKEISIFGIDCYRTGYYFSGVDDSIPLDVNNSQLVEKLKNAHAVDLEEKFIGQMVDSRDNVLWYR